MMPATTLQIPDGFSRIYFTGKNEVLPEESNLSVFDGNTAQLFPDRKPETSLVLPSGETGKDWPSVERILKRAMTLSLGRDGLITAIGGGVVGDTTAFAASIYMRGCRLILVPTTLLAMVDASIGGKTGIDFQGGKNLVGTFYPAEEVRICLEFLDTLPEREYRGGLAEVIKHAMLAPGKLWDIVVNEREDIFNRNKTVLRELVLEAIKVKIDIVTADLNDKNQRAFLNLGHTFAHAMESATNFCRVTHGEAVAWGMTKALELGERLSITDKVWAEECRQLIYGYGFDNLSSQVLPDELKTAMIHDKKKQNGQLRFILMKGPGKPVLQKVSQTDLDAVLGYL